MSHSSCSMVVPVKAPFTLQQDCPSNCHNYTNNVCMFSSKLIFKHKLLNLALYSGGKLPHPQLMHVLPAHVLTNNPAEFLRGLQVYGGEIAGRGGAMS